VPKQKRTYGGYEHEEEATQVVGRDGQAVSPGSCLSQVLVRGAQAVARDAASSAPRVLHRDAESVARRNARSASQVIGRGAQAGALDCVSQVLDRGAQAGAQTSACGDATSPHQEKGTRQMGRETE
jgi:hypothetical protein